MSRAFADAIRVAKRQLQVLFGCPHGCYPRLSTRQACRDGSRQGAPGAARGDGLARMAKSAYPVCVYEVVANGIASVVAALEQD